jgi:phosphoglycerate dehydrogenase-like enzyme
MGRPYARQYAGMHTEPRTPQRLLCSEEAWRRYGGRIKALAPHVSPLLLGTDAPAQGPEAELAWLTFDLWESGSIRAFVDHLREDGALQWLHTDSAGVDRPVYAELVQRGVRLTNAHVTGDSIADFVVRAVLDIYQDAGAWRQAQGQHRWERHRFRAVAGSTWLVVGLGAIGRATAVRARAFGARVVGIRRRPSGDEPCEQVLTPDALAGAVGDADVVVLALPLSAATRDLFDASLLGAMAPGSVLVNVSRGPLVDEGALVGALDNGRPGWAVLDVFRTEPLPTDSPLWDHPQVVVTPHNSAGGAVSEELAAQAFMANLRRFTAGEELESDASEEALAAAG